MSRKRLANNWGRIGALATTGGVIAVAAVMLLLPAASALTISRPFKGYAISLQDNKSYGGCGSIHEIKAPKWETKAGMMIGDGTATSAACKGSKSSANLADWITTANLVGSLHFKANGTHNLTNLWKVAWTASWSVTPFVGCKLNYSAAFSECYASAEVEFYGQELVYDQTTGTNFALAQSPTGFPASFANYSYAENYSSNSCPTCTPSGGNFSSGSALSGTFTGTTLANATIVNYTVNNVDTYYYNIFCIVWVLTTAETSNAHATSGGVASATANFAGTGRGVTLGGIVIS